MADEPEICASVLPRERHRGSRVESTPRFRWTFLIERGGTELTWETTFRVRTIDQIVRDLEAASFSLLDIRDSHIFLAVRAEDGQPS